MSPSQPAPDVDAQPDLEQLLASTEQAIAQERGLFAWLRSRPTSFRRTVGVCVALSVPLALAVLRPRADLGLHPALTLGSLVLLQALLVVALVSSKLSSLAQPALGPGRSGVLMVLCALAAAAPALLAPAQLIHPASLGGTGADFWPRAGACFLVGSLLGLAAVAAVVALDRALGWQKLLLGALVGMTGMLALQLHCPLVHAGHLWVGHAGIFVVAVIVAGVGSLLASRPRSS
jgi:hypothetical protein